MTDDMTPQDPADPTPQQEVEEPTPGDAPGENGAPGDYEDSQTAEATDATFDAEGTQPENVVDESENKDGSEDDGA